MKIQILSATQVQATSKQNKPYNRLELSFKNLATGKIEGKNIMPFGTTKDTFEALATASSGDVYEITTVKGASGFWEWTAAARSTADTPSAPPSAYLPRSASNPAPRSNYETPEERAARQVYIIRQSSISSAVAMLTPGSKSSLDVDRVLEVASKLEDFVFNGSNGQQEKAPEPGIAESLADMEDDIPY